MREAARAIAAQPSDGITPIFRVPASHWADVNAYDPTAAAPALRMPILVVQGGRDYQVTDADLDRYKSALAGHPNVTIEECPLLNHLFMAVGLDFGPRDYDRPGHVDPAVIASISTFIASLR